MQKTSVNPLENIIKNIIKEKNFITIEEFMSLSLNHPQYGYYCNTLPIGKEHDFTTSPEISQLFGEMLAFWIIEKWHQLNKPKILNILELGPGNGTLLIDIFNILNKFPEIMNSIRLILVEINTKLQVLQKNKLTSILKNTHITPIWINHLSEINYIVNTNSFPHIIIANEFLDTLPTKQFKFINNHWHEVIVTLSNEKFILALNKQACEITPALTQQQHPNPNMIFEYSPSTLNYINIIANLIIKNTGNAVIIDYGYIENKFTNTIQAISKHKKSNFLDNVGNQDISYLVNFPLIIQKLKQLNVNYNITIQNKFLINLGINERTNKLLSCANTSQKDAIIAGVKRILDINNMGSLFKVLEISSMNL